MKKLLIGFITLAATQASSAVWEGNLPSIPTVSVQESHLGLETQKGYLEGCTNKAVLNNAKVCLKIEALAVGSKPDPIHKSFLVADTPSNAKVSLNTINGPSAYFDFAKNTKVHCLGIPGLSNSLLIIKKAKETYTFNAKKWGSGLWSLTSATGLQCKFKGSMFKLKFKPV